MQAAVWSASPASIAQTWVAGRALFADGRIAGLDEPSLREEARLRAAAIVQRAGLDRDAPVETTLYS